MKHLLFVAAGASVLLASGQVSAQAYGKDSDERIMNETRYNSNRYSSIQERATTRENVDSRTGHEPKTKRNTNDVDYRSGIYGGAYGGHAWTNADVDSAGTADVNGWDYGFFAGVELDAFFDRSFGLKGALEGFYGWSNAEDTAMVSGAPVDIEKEHEWGINFRPGLSFVDAYSPFGVKPYGILGYRRTQLQTTTPGTGDEENFNGFELGVGSELVAYDDFGVRLDYSHVFYKERSGIDPDENDLRLGLSYHF